MKPIVFAGCIGTLLMMGLMVYLIAVPNPAPVYPKITFEQIRGITQSQQGDIFQLSGFVLQHEDGWVERSIALSDYDIFTHMPVNQYTVLFYLGANPGLVQATYNSGAPIIVVLAPQHLNLSPSMPITVMGNIWIGVGPNSNLVLPYMLLQSYSQ